jgi:putative transposase
MARLPRTLLPGQAHHVVQRGNNRQAVFFAESDYRLYLDSLQQAADRYSCAVHAYVLMTNHVHLLVTPDTESGISKMMQSIGRRYVRYINALYQRSGTLWEGRFKAALIDSEPYLFTCMRYIELNPVRAGVVDEPGGYRWSSYRCNAHGHSCQLLTPHRLYGALGVSDHTRQRAYHDLFKVIINMERLERIRAATQSGEIIGHRRFRDEITAALKRRVEKMAHGGDRKSESFRKKRRSSTLTP